MNGAATRIARTALARAKHRYFVGLRRSSWTRELSTTALLGTDGRRTLSTSQRIQFTANANSNHIQKQAPKHPEIPQEQNKIKALFKEYGRVALVVYLALGGTIFAGCFFAVSQLGVDVEKILKQVSQIKDKLLGTTSSIESSNDPTTTTADASHTSSESEPKEKSLFKLILLSIALTKLFSPFKIMATIAITPMLARRLRLWGFDVGGKGLRNTAREIKNEIRDSVKEMRDERKLKKIQKL